VNAGTYRVWLAALESGTSASLYVHIPFCESLCWFCACHTKATRRYEPVAAYLRSLTNEIDLIGHALPDGITVRQIHWGGGSPTILKEQDITALASNIRDTFKIQPAAEFSVEIDPRRLTSDQTDALIAAGLTRVSIGVQDFDPNVQRAINRTQSYQLTRSVIESFRLLGISSINADMIYGLPRQKIREIAQTVLKVMALDADRIALFGYAHVPWLKKHQTMIAETDLPGTVERFQQARIAERMIIDGGYQPIGMDHFAKPNDRLAIAARTGRLRRNFQGYTDDCSDIVIGLGASAISRLPQGYVQNAVAVGQYAGMTQAGLLPVARGLALTTEDQVRAHAIERLMCDFRVTGLELRGLYGDEAEGVIADLERIAAADTDGLVANPGRSLLVTDKGRPFVRSICAQLDSYFIAGNARHSLAI
jgi:oxygen-independent coproporphyrinogen-3 oxidase